jgi:hypothetical protein
MHSLVITSGLVEASQAKATYGHWRMKTQCKPDLTLHYWKSCSLTNLPAYMAYKVNELNPGTMTTADSRLAMLHTDPISCILLVIQGMSSSRPPIITLVAAPSEATISAS